MSFRNTFVLSAFAGVAVWLSGAVPSAAEARDFEIGPAVEAGTVEGWTIYRAGSWCIARAAADGDPAEQVFVAFDRQLEIGLLGAQATDRPVLLNVFADTRISVAVDGAEVAAGVATGMIRTEALLERIIPALVVTDYFADAAGSGPIIADTVAEGYRIAGRRLLNGIRVDADPETIWGPIRAGDTLSVTATATGEPLVDAVFSLKGSARMFREVRACARSTG